MHDHQSHNHDHSGIRNIKIAFFLNLIFTIFEIVGGIMTNSVAIISDALHDLGDSFALGLSWYLEKVAKRKKTFQFSYGFQRFSLLGALINSLILVIGALIVLSYAVPRILNPEPTVVEGMLIISLIGILINGLAVLKVRGGKTLNERVVTWHLLEDVLSWVTILIVSVVMYFTDLFILDPILSILITLYVLRNVYKNLKETVMIFLQGVPNDVDVNKIEEFVNKIKNVISVHDIHVWSLDGEHNILTTHIVLDKNCSMDDAIQAKCAVKACMGKFNVQHATIEVEHPNEKCELTHCTVDF